MKRRVLFSVLMVALLAASLGAPLASAQGEQPSEPGLVIVRVDADGPAAQAGVKRGDILLAVDGQETNRSLDWFRALRSLEAGQEIELQVMHGDVARTLTAAVGERNGRPYLGLQVYLGGAEDVLESETLEMPALPVITALAGAQVLEIVADSPAALAGLAVGDVITAVDGKTLDGEASLAELIAAYQPGDAVTLTVARAGSDGESEELSVTLVENPDDATRAFLGIRYANAMEWQGLQEQIMPFFEGRGDRGMPFGQTTPDQQGTPEVTALAGAMVRTVVEDSPAAEAGLQVGDVITAVDGEAIDGPQALVDAVGALKPGAVVALAVTRAGEDQPLEIEVTLGESPQTAGKAYLGVTVGAAQMRMWRQRQGAPERAPNGMRFRLPFGLGEFQLDLDQLPFELPLPGLQQQQPGQSGA